MSSNPLKIIAFFGSDLPRGRELRHLGKARDAGYVLLALDSAAMAVASRLDLPFTLLDDWIEPRRIARAVKDACQCEESWFEAARDLFTVDGICWPELDRSAMRWFWPEAMLALELADALSARNCSHLIFFRNLYPRVMVGHHRSDASGQLWKVRLPGRTSSRLISDGFSALRSTGLTAKIASRLRGVRNPAAPSDTPSPSAGIPGGSVVMVMGPGEEVRFTGLLNLMNERFAGRTAAVIAGPRSEASARIAGQWGVPVVYGPSWPIHFGLTSLPSFLAPTIDRPLARQFSEGYQRAVEASAGELWNIPLKHLGYQFSYYCKYRWPYLRKVCFDFWRRLWEDVRPEAVMVTTRDEAVTGLAVVAANRLGIPTFAAPHGGNSGVKRDSNPLAADYVLCNSPLQMRLFEQRGVPKSRIVGCRGLLAKNEYSVGRSELERKPGKLTVLALAESTGEGTNMIKYTSLSAQLKALRVLSAIPEDVKGLVNLAIKVHPHIPDLEIMEAAGEETLRRVMPLASDLHEALEESDLVVAVNYRGTALLHAIAMGKPVASLLTESEVLWDRPDFPFTHMTEATTVVRSYSEFWGLIRRMLHRSAVPDEMRAKALLYFQRHLDDSSFPLVSDFVHAAARS